MKTADLADCLIGLAKNPKHIMKSRSTAETILLSISKPPSEVGFCDKTFPDSMKDIILKPAYLKQLCSFKGYDGFIASLRDKLEPLESEKLTDLLQAL